MIIENLKALALPSVSQPYEVRDTILYALGLGYGSNPLEPGELQFIYEKNLKVVPSLCVVLSHPGFWVQRPELGIDWVKVLHAEQAFEIHAPFPVSGATRGEYSILGLEDKGPGKGALLHQQKILYDESTGHRLATVRSTLFLRGDGGLGGYGQPVAPPLPLPDRAPDRTVEIPTLPQQALIYRLSGDWNPLHADPAIAAAAGFQRPILQGLCTNGIACRAVIQAYCGHQPERLRSMFVRFSSPVLPGETIRFEFFEEAETLRFRARVVERDVVVLDRASVAITG